MLFQTCISFLFMLITKEDILKNACNQMHNMEKNTIEVNNTSYGLFTNILQNIFFRDQFGTTWGWVHDDWQKFCDRTIPFKPLINTNSAAK